jgi:anaerobic magnesium-protoporphyrin IX monomethyl ester cyclase
VLSANVIDTSNQIDGHVQGRTVCGASVSPKVLLIRPPQHFRYGVWPRGPRLSIPTGLLGIGSYLKNNGVQVGIYDSFVEGDDFDGDTFTNKHYYKRSKSQGGITTKWINWFESGSISPSAEEGQSGQDTVHFGSSWQQLETAIATIKPDIVGITNLFRENSIETMKVASLVKKLLPNCLVIVGGPNANAMPDQLMRDCPAIDLIGFGDGEHLMLQVTKYYAGAVPFTSIHGLMYRDSQGELNRTSAAVNAMDLDEYGPLDYSLIHLERYFAYERGGIMARNKFVYPGADRTVSMVTSRGCPYSCSFCSVHIHAGKKFRRHSIQYLVSQIEYLVNVCRVQHIHFEDDNLTLDLNRFVALLSEIIRRDLRFTWDTPNGVFAENLDESLLLLMKRAGCTYLIIGVESGDQWVLDNIIRKQPLRLESVLASFDSGTRVGLDLHAFYIIGFPGESIDQINRTLEFALHGLKRYGVIPHLSLARADPGTSLYQEALSTNTLATDFPIGNAAGVRADMFRRHLIRTDEFTPGILEAKNEEFHKLCIKYIVKDRLRFLLSRPRDIIDVASVLFHDMFVEKMTLGQAVIKIFWSKLLYKNAMMSRESRFSLKRRPAEVVSSSKSGVLPRLRLDERKGSRSAGA